MAEIAKCELCGEPMPEGEQMFKFHGYSGPCPKPPKESPKQVSPPPEAPITDSDLQYLDQAAAHADEGPLGEPAARSILNIALRLVKERGASGE